MSCTAFLAAAHWPRRSRHRGLGEELPHQSGAHHLIRGSAILVIWRRQTFAPPSLAGVNAGPSGRGPSVPRRRCGEVADLG